MEQGQRQFYNFIMDRVKEDRISEAKDLLGKSFAKQNEGSFSRDDAGQFSGRIMGLLKEDKIDEVSTVMAQFSQNLEK